MATMSGRFGVLLSLGLLASAGRAPAGVLDRQGRLDALTFWDNRDGEWFKKNVPFFECPDADLTATWYYRWELVTKHLTYGSPNTGYTFTEFIDRPFWSGAYGAISCPAGHQLYEVRWLRDPRYARDFARYWFRTPGAQPRNYSTWLADAVWALHQVHPDDAFLKDLLPDLVKNFRGWERRHWDGEVGLFWQTGHDDGMEYNVNSRQTADPVRGAPAYRPTLNSYLWADARAIARVSALAGDAKQAAAWRDKAGRLKRAVQAKLWDPKRKFFFPMARRDESKDGHTVKALSLTYQTGKYAGDGHGRELIGYVPWQFGLPDAGYEAAWMPLMDRKGFFADFGPTTVERHDPLFHLSKTCCYWSGQSWPFATTQTLRAMANLLHDYRQSVVSRADYLKLLQIYAKTHRKAGRPYLAEAAHPDTGSWEGHDSYNHSEHYFHSGFNDLIVTALVGLRPRDDDTVEVRPLAPENWAWFAIDAVPYRGHELAVVWDRDGTRYRLGKGLHLVVDGDVVATSPRLDRLTARLAVRPAVRSRGTRVNFAVNNDGHYYPRASASHTAPGTSVGKVIDGSYWYHAAPPNRWTSAGSSQKADWVALDFGTARMIDEVRLYVLDDGKGVVAPGRIDLEYHDGTTWRAVPGARPTPGKPTGHMANIIRFPAREVRRLRAVFTHAEAGRTGLTEFEAWGSATLPVAAPPPPAGNLAYNAGGKKFPKASASFTSRFDRVEEVNDGRISFGASPHNRWTSYESPNTRDWLEIDFGAAKKVARLELGVYDDGGGVRAPASFAVEYDGGDGWRQVEGARRTPEKPAGGQFNEVHFRPVTATRVRVVFTHQGRARSGLTELLIWPD